MKLFKGEKASAALSRRGFLKKAGAVAVSAALACTMFGCSSGASSSASSAAGTAAELDYSDWNAVLEAAKGQTVTFYGWGGSEPRNTWIEESLVPAMKEKYDITLELVGMDINDILTQLSGDKQANTEEGTIDFIWINGENFYTAKENGYLWGPFTDYLPNFNDYVDAASPEVEYDFGSPTEGYEAPYGKTQMEMWVNSEVVPTPPTTVEEFKAFCEANPGKVTYPQPGDFTGTAFISCLISGVIGADEFEKLSMMDDPTTEEVKEIIEPGLEYLRSLNPSLWNQGQTFPADSTTMGTMYADGEVIMNMGYGDPQALVDAGTLPATTKPFIFNTGTVGNSNFMAIAYNAPHKAAALVAINEIMSPEMQLEQYEVLGNLTVLDTAKLPEADQQAFADVQLGASQLPSEELLSHRVTEAAGPVIPIIEQLWLDEVVGK
ncbi:ABC transporter substrate-binding protein [Adlercreutzia murintestinalis]|uniref:ABC transporter substrate-binding protein n=1 Tax=Adlercreutzia murintestinalis TaxID=2941325 RepID=UPI00203D27CC|nr:ABC transporter substrate-binding protein [Adlercreutzia murintestinalis]